jgi:hypothetical protein
MKRYGVWQVRANYGRALQIENHRVFSDRLTARFGRGTQVKFVPAVPQPCQIVVMERAERLARLHFVAQPARSAAIGRPQPLPLQL